MSSIAGGPFWLIDEKRGLQIVNIVQNESHGVLVEPIPQSCCDSRSSWEVDQQSLHSDTSSLDQLVNIKDFTQNNIVNSLIWRAKKNEIYTNSGLFTLAMNPFKNIEGQFSKEKVELWQTDATGNSCATPHAYSVAEMAYRGMSDLQIDQSILVSGMSGAGKTETVKICINYLSSIGGNTSSVETNIGSAGLILESFGNALTIHNGNSSRFGKYTKMFFKHHGHMIGAELKTYLLEKTRVSHPPSSERNFHVFYQLIHGMDQESKNKLGLAQLTSAASSSSPAREIDSFEILNTKAIVPDSQQEVDKLAYQELLVHLRELGFTDSEIQQILSTLAAILHLGNISFGEKPPSTDTISALSSSLSDSTGPRESLTPKSRSRLSIRAELEGESFVANVDALEKASQLLGVSPLSLETALTKLSLKSVASAVIPLPRSKAELSRASLCEEIYERLFAWILSKINQTLQPEEDPDDCGYIAVLDISGYETVNVNGFEQLTINYTNDKLQQLYNEIIYREQKLYEAEFGWQPIEFDIDLQNSIGILDKKPDGLFSVLDDVCYRQNGSDALFIGELHTYPVSTSKGQRSKQLNIVDFEKLEFSIPHAPSDVHYRAHNFVLKNRDLLASSLDVLMRSSSSLCKTLFSSPSEKGQSSVAKFYVQQMSDLMDAIRETDFSFIKCIKPNAQSIPDLYDAEYIADQIKWSTVPETLQICSRGFPHHISYEAFVQAFASLVPAQIGEVPKATSIRIANTHLGEFPQSGGYAPGKTMMFVSMTSFFKLQTLLKTQANSPTGDWVSKAKSAFNWLWS